MTNIIFASYVLLTSLGLVAIKYGADKGMPFSLFGDKLSFNIGLYTISGVFFYGLSFLLYIYLISKNDLGYIIPLTTACVYILIFLASFFLFKEAFPMSKVIAIGLILSGVLLLNASK